MKPFWATLLLVLSAPLALAEETTVDQAVGAANTSWIMTATALVLFMTLPGLALFYGGLVHKKNVLSVLMHCFAMACILSVVWLVAGYSLALTGGNNWFGGLDALFGKGLDGSAVSPPIFVPLILVLMFQHLILYFVQQHQIFLIEDYSLVWSQKLLSSRFYQD